MAALRLRARPPCHFAWLLWIVMLLPMAQSAATWHALWHTAQEASHSVDAHGKQAPKPERCDLCVTAASIHSGALPSALPFVPHASVRHEAPQAAFASLWHGSPARAYRSRAPPDASH